MICVPARDYRRHRTEMACKKFPVLSHLITSCISMDPEYRLTSSRALKVYVLLEQATSPVV